MTAAKKCPRCRSIYAVSDEEHGIYCRQEMNEMLRKISEEYDGNELQDRFPDESTRPFVIRYNLGPRNIPVIGLHDRAGRHLLAAIMERETAKPEFNQMA